MANTSYKNAILVTLLIVPLFAASFTVVTQNSFAVPEELEGLCPKGWDLLPIELLEPGDQNFAEVVDSANRIIDGFVCTKFFSNVGHFAIRDNVVGLGTS